MVCFGKGMIEENFSYSFFTNPEIILGTTNLTNQQKILYRRRFMKKLYNLRKLKHYFAVMYYMHKFLSTTLGVAIPALLSIQYYYQSDNGNGLNNPIYWSAWALSLFGGFISGYSNIFKVDDRFYLLKSIYQKMKYEGWIFLLLCKKYDIKIENGDKMKHKQLFSMFMESIENIIDDYKRSDMATIMEDNKDDIIEMQQRAMSDKSEIENTNDVSVLKVPQLNLPNLKSETRDIPEMYGGVISKHPYTEEQV